MIEEQQSRVTAIRSRFDGLDLRVRALVRNLLGESRDRVTNQLVVGHFRLVLIILAPVVALDRDPDFPGGAVLRVVDFVVDDLVIAYRRILVREECQSAVLIPRGRAKVDADQRVLDIVADDLAVRRRVEEPSPRGDDGRDVD
ncbi:MAG: hypothetical protein ABEI11_02070 [Haloarculaceae archaeon]